MQLDVFVALGLLLVRYAFRSESEGVRGSGRCKLDAACPERLVVDGRDRVQIVGAVKPEKLREGADYASGRIAYLQPIDLESIISTLTQLFWLDR